MNPFFFRRMNTRWAFPTWEFVMMADVRFTPTNKQWIYFSMVRLTFLLVWCCDFSVIVYPILILILKVTKNTYNILKCIWRQSRLQIAFHIVLMWWNFATETVHRFKIRIHPSCTLKINTYVLLETIFWIFFLAWHIACLFQITLIKIKQSCGFIFLKKTTYVLKIFWIKCFEK